MPGHIQTYGRRAARQNTFVAQCFAASSSPMKPELDTSALELDLSPAQSTRSKSLVRETSFNPSDDVFQSKAYRSNEIEPLVELVENLGIRDGGEDSPSRLPRLKRDPTQEHGNDDIGRALRDRDANAYAARSDGNNEGIKRDGSKRQGRKLKTEGGRALRNRRKVRGEHYAAETFSPTVALVDQADSAQRGSPRITTSRGSSQKKHSPTFTHHYSIPRAPISPTPSQNRPRRTRAAQVAGTATVQKKQAVASPPPDLLLVEHVRPLLDLCNDSTGRLSPNPFADWASNISQHLNITKIAEASYAEVYRLSLKTSTSTLTSNDESVLKIIPLKPPDETIPTLTKPQRSRVESSMSAVRDVAAEVTLLRHMSTVPGFANFRDVRVMVGRPPTEIVSAWRAWNEHSKAVKGEGSEFVDPGRKGSYAEGQLWAVVEMQDAGRDLEGWCEGQGYEAVANGDAKPTGTCASEDGQATDERIKAFRQVWGVWDAFWGVALSLAKGEEWAGFEHRDLHLGNVCIRLPPTLSSQSQPSKFTIDTTKNLNFTGVETTIIDYTLSRANLSRDTASTPSEESSSPETTDEIAFHDLSRDPDVFAGDGADDYQYDIYRHMRGAVLFGDPNITEMPTGKRPRGRKGAKRAVVAEQNEEEQREKWRAHHPMTNLVWLHFVLHKLTELLLMEWPSSSSSSSSSSLSSSSGRTKARGNGKRRPPASSLAEDQEKGVKEKALELEHRLLELRDEVLDLEKMKAPWVLQEEVGRVGSAVKLVEWAVERGWFGEEDVLEA